MVAWNNSEFFSSFDTPFASPIPQARLNWEPKSSQLSPTVAKVVELLTQLAELQAEQALQGLLVEKIDEAELPSLFLSSNKDLSYLFERGPEIECYQRYEWPE